MSVRKAVDEINESLSNAIPELVLLLIALQEQNAPPPPQVPLHIGAVASAAEVLGSVCEALARDEYGEHPAIQQEILTAADDVSKSAKRLRTSGDALALGKAESRKEAYGTVMDAAKVIAANCIKVLAIVYGAFFKRVAAIADETRAIAEDIDSSTAKADPQSFADKVGAAATKAGLLAARMRELAANEESPLAKKELGAAADELDARGDALVARCNEYLADMGNAPLRQKLDEELSRFVAAVDSGMKPVRERQQELQSQQIDQRKLEPAPPAVASTKAKFAPKPAAASIPQAPAPAPTPKLKEEVAKQREAVDDLVKQTEAGNAAEVVAEAKSIAARQPSLVALAKRAAEASGDQGRVSKVKDAGRELDEALPLLIAATKSVLQDPQSEEKREALEAKAKVMEGALETLAGEEASPAMALVQSASEAKEALEELRRAKAAGDGERAKRAAANLSAVRPHVVHDAASMAASVRDAGARKNALASAAALESAPQLTAAAVDAVVQDTRAVPIAEAEVAQRELERLVAASRDGDATAAKDAAAALAAASESVADELREISAERPARELESALPGVLVERVTEPAADRMRKAIGAAVDAMNPAKAPSAMSPQSAKKADPQARSLEAAKRAAASVLRSLDGAVAMAPSNPDAFRKKANEAADKLELIADSIKISPEEKLAADAEKLADVCQSVADSACDQKLEAFEVGMKVLAEEQPRLVQGARAVAAAAGDGDRRSEVQDAAAEVEKLIPKMTAVARAAASNPAKAAECQAAARAARNALRMLADAACPAPEIRAAAAEEALRQAIAESREAIAKQNSEAAAAAARKAADAAGSMESPKVTAAVSNLRRSPMSKQAVDEVEKALGDAAAAALPERERKQLDLLCDAVVSRHDPQETIRHARDVAATQQKLADHSRAVAMTMPPEARRRVETAVSQLEELLPALVAASKEALQTPSPAADEKVTDGVFEMKTKISEIQAKTPAEVAVAKARGNVTALAKATRAKDGAAADRALAAARASAEELSRIPKDPQWDAEAVDRAISEFGSATTAQRMVAPIEKLEELVSSGPPRSDAVDTRDKIKAVAIKARKGAVTCNRRDLDDLLRAGRKLADSLEGLSDAARTAAAAGGPTSDRGRAALALDDLLRGMESGKAPALASVAAAAEKVFAPEPTVVAAAAAGKRDFADSMSKVASDIQEVAARHKRDADLPNIAGLDASPLAEQIKRMAQAARSNQRQQMLVCGRAIAAYIASFCTELRALADRCKDPTFQDKMYRSAAALKNFSVQLKILSAVKAASATDDSDADDQIISVTQSLGKSMADALKSIEISKKAGLLR